MSQSDRYPFESDADYLAKLRHELVRDRFGTDWTSIPLPVIKDALASYEKDARIAALEALAKEAGELMMVLLPECKVHGCPMHDFYAKLRAAGLMKGGE